MNAQDCASKHSVLIIEFELNGRNRWVLGTASHLMKDAFNCFAKLALGGEKKSDKPKFALTR